MANEARTGVLQGTLDLMILQTLATLGPQHGYAIAARLEQVSGGALQLNMGTLYPGLVRLESRGGIAARWAQTESNRRARFYELTAERPAGAREETRRLAADGRHHGPSAGVATCAGGCWRLGRMLGRDRSSGETAGGAAVPFRHGSRGRGAQPASHPKRHGGGRRWRAGLVSDGMESTREALGIRWIDGMCGDLRHASRALTRNPGFGTVAVLVLAATVAVNTLIFFMLEGVVLRALPYRSPERLVRLYDSSQGAAEVPDVDRPLPRLPRERQIPRLGIALYTGMDMELSATGRALAAPDRRGHHPGVLRRARQGPAAGPRVHRRATSARWPARHPQRTRVAQRLPARPGDRRPERSGSNREAWTVVGVAPEGFQHVGGEYRSPLQGETVDVWLPLRRGGGRGHDALQPLLQRHRTHPRRLHARPGAPGARGAGSSATSSSTRKRAGGAFAWSRCSAR